MTPSWAKWEPITLGILRCREPEEKSRIDLKTNNKLIGNFRTIDPYLIIYHDCENTKLSVGGKSVDVQIIMFQGRRQLQIWIPDKYVSEGKLPLKTYDFYQVTLDKFDSYLREQLWMRKIRM